MTVWLTNGKPKFEAERQLGFGASNLGSSAIGNFEINNTQSNSHILGIIRDTPSCVKKSQQSTSMNLELLLKDANELDPNALTSPVIDFIKNINDGKYNL